MAGEDERCVAPGSVSDGRDAGIEFDGVGDGACGVEQESNSVPSTTERPNRRSSGRSSATV